MIGRSSETLFSFHHNIIVIIADRDDARDWIISKKKANTLPDTESVQENVKHRTKDRI